tara:strand:+ start:648 stop:1124 length:477 start_codon:yes stop_codon:yes gene_type:complete
MRFLLFFIILFFINCENKKPSALENNELLEEYRTKEDTVKFGPKVPSYRNPINLSFLTERSYKDAQKAFGVPFSEAHFVLNKEPLKGIRKFLVKNFTKNELTMPITLKEVKWDNKEDDYILVYYQIKDSLWQPIQGIKYGKDTPLNETDFENISPKEE